MEKLEQMKRERYASFDTGDGRAFEEGRLSLQDIAENRMKVTDTKISGKQELIQNIINQYMFS